MFPCQNQFVNNTPIWAHIYHLLRSGNDEAALEFAIDNEMYLQKTERPFLVYLKAYMENGDRRYVMTTKYSSFVDS